MKNKHYRKLGITLFSSIIALAMIFSTIPMSIFAEEGDPVCSCGEALCAVDSINEDCAVCADNFADCTFEAQEENDDNNDNNDDDNDDNNDDNSAAITVAAFDELAEDVLSQEYDYGAIESQDGINLPGELAATDADGGALNIDVTWTSNPEFDAAVSAQYYFSPVLPEGYELAQDVTAPQISVFIRPNGDAEFGINSGAAADFTGNYTLYLDNDGTLYAGSNKTAPIPENTDDRHNGFTYDEGTKTLTLTNFDYTLDLSAAAATENTVLSVPAGTTIKLGGKNYLRVTNSAGDYANQSAYGIYVRGTGTSGTLTIEASGTSTNAELYVWAPDVVAPVTWGAVGDIQSVGIYTNGDFTVNFAPKTGVTSYKVQAIGGAMSRAADNNGDDDDDTVSGHAMRSAGIYVNNGDFTANNRAEVISKGSNIQISDDSTPVTPSDDIYYGSADAHSYGIHAHHGNVVINDSAEVDADGGQTRGRTAVNESYGVYSSGNLMGVTVNGGLLDAQGANTMAVGTHTSTSNSKSFGVFAEGYAEVHGGELIAIGGNTTTATVSGYSYGVCVADGEPENEVNYVTITDGDVTAEGGNAETDSYGIFAEDGDVTISGTGAIEAHGGISADTDSAGIMAMNGNVVIQNYNNTTDGLWASGDNALSGSAGIAAPNGEIEIKDSGIILANSGTVTTGNSTGFLAEGDITINRSMAAAASESVGTGNSIGILSATGDIAISNDSIIHAMGDTAVAGSSYGISAASGEVTIDKSQVTAESSSAGAFSYAVMSGEKMSITNKSDVVATAGTTASNSVGLISMDEFTINNSKVTGTGRNATTVSAGLIGINDLTIKTGDKTVTGRAGTAVTSVGIMSNGELGFTLDSKGIIIGDGNTSAFQDSTAPTNQPDIKPTTYKYKIGAFTANLTETAWTTMGAAPNFASKQIWLTRKGGTSTSTGGSGGGNGGSYSGGGGGGGGGGSSFVASVGNCTTTWLEKAATKPLIDKAKKAGILELYTKSTCTHGVNGCQYGVRKESLAAMAGYTYKHDTYLGKVVQVRVYINESAKIKKDILVSGWVNGKDVDAVYAKFTKWHSNKLRVIHMDQKENWGATIRIAAKVNLSGMDTSKLCFYAYNKKANSYKRIAAPDYYIDNHGYLNFATPYAGDLIVSEKPLVKKK